MKKFIEIFFGLLLVVVAVYIAVVVPRWLMSTIHLMRGGVIIGLVLIGIALILIGFSELKS